jgi:hypothetical protein
MATDIAYNTVSTLCSGVAKLGSLGVAFVCPAAALVSTDMVKGTLAAAATTAGTKLIKGLSCIFLNIKNRLYKGESSN